MALLSVHFLPSTFFNAAGPAPSSSSFFSGSQGDFQVHTELVVFGFWVFCLVSVDSLWLLINQFTRCRDFLELLVNLSLGYGCCMFLMSFLN
jgi:hypothetical protein